MASENISNYFWRSQRTGRWMDEEKGDTRKKMTLRLDEALWEDFHVKMRGQIKAQRLLEDWIQTWVYGTPGQYNLDEVLAKTPRYEAFFRELAGILDRIGDQSVQEAAIESLLAAARLHLSVSE